MCTEEIVALHAETVRRYREDRLAPLFRLEGFVLINVVVWGLILFAVLLLAPSLDYERYELPPTPLIGQPAYHRLP